MCVRAYSIQPMGSECGFTYWTQSWDKNSCVLTGSRTMKVCDCVFTGCNLKGSGCLHVYSLDTAK